MNTSSGVSSSLLRTLTLWSIAMGWHVWRAMTGRPDFAHLKPSNFTFYSFLAVYALAGVLRWVHVTEKTDSYLIVLVSLFIHLVICLFIARLFGASGKFLLVAMLISIGVDSLAMSLALIGLDDGYASPWGMVLEWGLIFWSAWRLAIHERNSKGSRPVQ